MIIQKPIEFKVVKGRSIEELESVVNVLLHEGWVPHGDWRTVTEGGRPVDERVLMYAQAMTKLGFIEVTMNQGGGLLVPR